MSRTLLPLTALLLLPAAEAQRVGVPTDDLNNLSVDDLFQLEVTSVDRKAQQLSKAPASIYVLTAEDIRRSGASSIPEALQWVPGLTVLHVAGGMWSVSARGDARLYSDKMLVMIDGRSLYTPLFSGVLWDLVDVPLDNIERIEIVRGPGAVMWGLNAVNGVINIITKKAQQNKGATIDVASGNDVRGSVFGRWSDTPTDHLAYQLWVKMDDENPAYSSPGYYRLDDFVTVQSQPIDNLRGQSARIGFRVDDQISDRDQLMIQGDAYRLGRHDELGFPILMQGISPGTPAVREATYRLDGLGPIRPEMSPACNSPMTRTTLITRSSRAISTTSPRISSRAGRWEREMKSTGVWDLNTIGTIPFAVGHSCNTTRPTRLTVTAMLFSATNCS